MEKIKRVADDLEYFNKWRSPHCVEDMPMPDPRKITEDIDFAIETLRFVALDAGSQAIANAALREQLYIAERRIEAAERTFQHLGASGKFLLGDRVRKTKGSRWQGRVVGYYSTHLTKNGVAVESETEVGSVQIYPVTALELVKD